MTEVIKKSAKSHPDKTAPGELALVHAFLNTWDMIGPRERFDTPDRMQSWFAKRSLIAPSAVVSQEQFARVISIREALRHLLSAAGEGRAPDRKIVWDLNRAAETMPLVVHFGEDGVPSLLPAASGLDAAMGRILAIVSAAVMDGDWERLKICRNFECQRTFFDKSKNKSAVWCTTQGCGNRLNARAFRARS